jgi:hypothetical protein
MVTNISFTDIATAMHMLLLKNTDDILPTEELKYMEVFTDVH